jgi:hypothetical protein
MTNGNCGICGLPLPPYRGVGRPQKFHEACLPERDERYNAARRLGARERTCVDCGEGFTYKSAVAVRCPAAVRGASAKAIGEAGRRHRFRRTRSSAPELQGRHVAGRAPGWNGDGPKQLTPMPTADDELDATPVAQTGPGLRRLTDDDTSPFARPDIADAADAA